METLGAYHKNISESPYGKSLIAGVVVASLGYGLWAHCKKKSADTEVQALTEQCSSKDAEIKKLKDAAEIENSKLKDFDIMENALKIAKRATNINFMEISCQLNSLRKENCLTDKSTKLTYSIARNKLEKSPLAQIQKSTTREGMTLAISNASNYHIWVDCAEQNLSFHARQLKDEFHENKSTPPSTNAYTPYVSSFSSESLVKKNNQIITRNKE